MVGNENCYSVCDNNGIDVPGSACWVIRIGEKATRASKMEKDEV